MNLILLPATVRVLKATQRNNVIGKFVEFFLEFANELSSLFAFALYIYDNNMVVE